MARYDIAQVGADGEKVTVGSIDWTPTGWEYQTSDEQVERFLSAVKADGSVTGYESLAIEDTVYSFVETEVEDSDPSFVGQVSDMMLRLTQPDDVPATWLEPRNGVME
jgi:hypothetical protein